MKKYIYIISLVAAAALVAVSCQKKEQEAMDNNKNNAVDVEGCYGVYFPVLEEEIKDKIFNPTEEPFIDVLVSRTNDKGAITVPVKASYSALDGASTDGVFVPGEVKFADGQKETTMHIAINVAPENDKDAPGARQGVKYSASFMIEDPQYASLYNSNPVSVDFSVMIVEMKETEVGPEAAEEGTATVTFTLNWWGIIVEAKIKYYEVDGVRTCETYDEKVIESGNEDAGEFGFWGGGEDNHLHFIWYTKKVDDYGHEAIDIPKQYLGFDYEDWLAKPVDQAISPIYAYDWFHFLITDGGYTGGWPDWEGFLERNPGAYDRSYYDGNGGFYLNFKYYIPGLGGWNPPTFDTIGIVPGYSRVDFSLKGIESDFTEDGVLPLAIYTGLDVTKVQYVVAAGQLTATQIANTVAAIADKTAENVYTVAGDDLVEAVYMEEDVLAAIEGVTLEATGEYTVVAVTFDDEGEVFDSGSLLVQYVAAGDEEANAVELYCGIGTAEKYAAKGVNPEAAVEIWVYGKDIVDAKVTVAKYVDLVSNMKGVIASLKESDSVSDSLLNVINGDGMISVVEKLLPGTEYYTLVWASNGYEEDVFISEASATTLGDPLPIYMDYTYEDYNEEFYPESQDVFIGKTFNLYATDLFGDLGINEYIGQVSITDSEIEDEGPDDDGFMDEYVTISGLSGGAAEEYGFVDDMTFDLYGGYLYMAENATLDADNDIAVYNMTETGSCYNAAWNAYFIPVLDGYYAYVCNSKYYASYNWNGLAFHDGTNFLAALCKLILVDPEKDDNGLAPAPASRMSMQRSFEIMGAVEAHKSAVHEQGKKAVKLSSNFKAVNSACPVKTVKVETTAINPYTHFAGNKINRKELEKKTTLNLR